MPSRRLGVSLRSHRAVARGVSAIVATERRIASFRIVVMMVHMRRTSLVQAKAHLSELVDLAEHNGQRVLICRHGKPAAAIVPVEVAEAPSGPGAPPPMTRHEAVALLARLARAGDHSFDALGDLSLGRSRLDRPGS